MNKKNISQGVSRLTVKRRLALIAIIFLVAGSLIYSKPANWLIQQSNSYLHTNFGLINKPFVLGLDLQGGTRLEYEADVSKIPDKDRSSAMEGVRDVIERRVNSMGVSEPVVQVTKSGDSWRVSAELAGVKDVNKAIKMIGETPILEFKTRNTDPPRELTEEEKKKIQDSQAQGEKKAKEFLNELAGQNDKFVSLAKKEAENDSEAVSYQDLGFIHDNPQFTVLFESLKNLKKGEITKDPIKVYGAEIVAQVEDTKPLDPEVKAKHILIAFKGSAAASSSTTRTKDEALQFAEDLRLKLTSENFDKFAKENSDEPGADKTGGELGWFSKGMMLKPFEDAVYKLDKGKISDVIETQFGYHIILKEDSRPLNDIKVAVLAFNVLEKEQILPPEEKWKSTGLTGKQLKDASLKFNQQTGSPEIALQFDSEGAKLFAKLTKENVGKQIAIFLDGSVISAPVVNQEIIGGQAVITNRQFDIKAAKLLAQRLKAGALPVPINLIMQQSVGPSLGADSVQASLVAGLWGFLLVILFMLILYRIPGFLADIALFVYGVLLLALFKTIPVTLTLSGIAGVVLSLGMAVDANVLIFERLKEELRSKKTYTQAVESAFQRAWPSIRDGNITTLISCVVLYGFTSSVIKGFALTLGIGILLSMFSAITITRNLLKFVAVEKIVNKMKWLFLIKNNKE